MKNRLFLVLSLFFCVPSYTSPSNRFSKDSYLVAVGVGLWVSLCYYYESHMRSVAAERHAQWAAEQLSPQGRLAAAENRLSYYREIPLYKEILSPDVEDKLLEGSNCYDGMITLPLINATQLLERIDQALKFSRKELELALVDEPQDEALKKRIETLLRDVCEAQKRININKRYVKNSPKWNESLEFYFKQQVVDSSKSIVDLQRKIANTEASKLNLKKYALSIDLIRLCSGR